MTRERVEPGIWRRGEVFEITWRDAQGKQLRKAVQGGITAARKALTDAKSKRDRGERTSDPRLTFTAAGDAWWAARVVELRPSTENAYSAALRHLRAAFRRRRVCRHRPHRGRSLRLTARCEGLDRQGRDDGPCRASSPTPAAILASRAEPRDAARSRRAAVQRRREAQADPCGGDELRRLLAAIDPEHRLIF